MNIHQRILEVMAAVETVRKDRWNPHHKYNFAGHDDVTSAIRRAMVRVGVTQSVTLLESARAEGIFYVRVKVRWTNSEQPDDFVEVESCGESQPSGKDGKPQPQQVGVAMSYAVKLAQLKNFMLLGDDTPDVERDDDQRNERQDAPKREPYTRGPAQGNGGEDDFEKYADMFRNVTKRPEYETLMSLVAKNRGHFSAQEIKELARLSRDADARLRGDLGESF